MADARSKFDLNGLRIGSELFLIAGPCVIESEAHALKMAQAIGAVAAKLKLPYVFKASYDKANRTSIKSFRGPGVKEGLRILAKVKDEARVPVLTDVHQSADVAAVAEVVDVIQIPAFLCRQTDLLIEAGKRARAVNIKKGQFVSPWDMRHAVEKVRESGNNNVFLTERGSSFGYNNLVVDMRSLAIMRQFAPVVFDATHSVQLPSAGKDGEAVSGGQPQFIPLLSRAAVAAGVDGVFMEVHDNPAQAKSDGPNALDLKNLEAVLAELLAIRKALENRSGDRPSSEIPKRSEGSI
jgi:2-dehydro-3-deoxyphosphooctonate aldolase (KDO 8-P synthase)